MVNYHHSQAIFAHFWFAALSAKEKQKKCYFHAVLNPDVAADEVVLTIVVFAKPSFLPFLSTIDSMQLSLFSSCSLTLHDSTTGF